MALLRLTAFAVFGMLGNVGALPSMMMLRLLKESFGHADVENIAKPAAPETLGVPETGDGDMTGFVWDWCEERGRVVCVLGDDIGFKQTI